MKKTFSHRVVDTWNGLHGRILNCNAIATFHTYIGLHL